MSLFESTPSAHLYAVDGRSRRSAGVADPDRERLKWAGERALPQGAVSALSGSSPCRENQDFWNSDFCGKTGQREASVVALAVVVQAVAIEMQGRQKAAMISGRRKHLALGRRVLEPGGSDRERDRLSTARSLPSKSPIARVLII